MTLVALQDCLYHHPVHKISFMAQDMTDTRAFGYIFGSPDAGHKFFGIKSEKAASQVVIAMRDLFQVSQRERGRAGGDTGLAFRILTLIIVTLFLWVQL